MRRFFGKLRLVTQIGEVKRNVNAKLEAFNAHRLLQKSIVSLKAYLTSDSCERYRKACQLREKLLRHRAISALKIVTARGNKLRFYQKRRESREKHDLLERWINSLDRIFKYRTIFSDLEHAQKERVFRVLKAHWARN